jgi:hypothetical protein
LGTEIIDTQDNGSIGNQALTQMGAEEAGTAGNQDPFFEMHLLDPAVIEPR